MTIIQVVLVVPFGLGGAAKLVMPYPQFTELPFQAWAQDYLPVHIRLIGLLEASAALASVAALLTGSVPGVAAAAAATMAVIMGGAMATHLRRREYVNVVGNAMWMVAALIVASARYEDFVI